MDQNQLAKLSKSFKYQNNRNKQEKSVLRRIDNIDKDYVSEKYNWLDSLENIKNMNTEQQIIQKFQEKTGDLQAKMKIERKPKDCLGIVRKKQKQNKKTRHVQTKSQIMQNEPTYQNYIYTEDQIQDKSKQQNAVQCLFQLSSNEPSIHDINKGSLTGWIGQFPKTQNTNKSYKKTYSSRSHATGSRTKILKQQKGIIEQVLNDNSKTRYLQKRLSTNNNQFSKIKKIEQECAIFFRNGIIKNLRKKQYVGRKTIENELRHTNYLMNKYKMQ